LIEHRSDVHLLDHIMSERLKVVLIPALGGVLGVVHSRSKDSSGVM
jgi:hypothetical protein